MEEKPSIMKTPRCVFLSNHTLTCVFLNYLPLNGCKSQVQGQNVGKKGVPSLNSIFQIHFFSCEIKKCLLVSKFENGW